MSNSGGGGMHKILKIYTQTRLSDTSVHINEDPIRIIRKAEEENRVHRFKKDVFFCAYKTEFEGKPSILLVFTMKLPGPTTGSSASSEIVMEVVSFMEKLFSPIDNMEFIRNIDNPKKNIAIMKIIKKIREEDLL